MNEEAEALLKRAVYAVEATYFESTTLLRKHQEDGLERLAGGGIETVSTITVDGSELPVCVRVSFAEHNGLVIAFYGACSKVVHKDHVRDWLDRHGFGVSHRTDALNFSLQQVAVRARVA